LSDPQAFAWLRGRRPLAQPGYSSFVYDISSDALSQFRIGEIYQRNGQLALAERQFKRAAALQPDQPYPFLALGDVYKSLGRKREAAGAYSESLQRAKSEGYRDLRPVIRERLRPALQP
jgi:tetratricopeptide (TPR) repeat protein